MASSPVVINNHPYHDTSSSCSSLEENLVNNQSKKKKQLNYSSQRSRTKKRMNDMVLQTKLTQLTNENEILRAKIEILKRKFGQEEEQQSSIQTIQSDIDPTTEQSAKIKSSMPIKLRFKQLNITSDL